MFIQVNTTNNSKHTLTCGPPEMQKNDLESASGASPGIIGRRSSGTKPLFLD